MAISSRSVCSSTLLPRSKPDGPFVEKFAQPREKRCGSAFLQGLPAHAALVELEALIDGGVGKTVDEQRDFLVVQNFDAGHIHSMRARIADVKGKEVHVIVYVAGVAVEFGVAVDLQVLAGIEQDQEGVERLMART